MGVAETKQQVRERDNETCQDCGADLSGDTPGEVHHRTPLSEGGDDTLSNLVLLCRGCHGGRHSSKEDGDEGRVLLTDREREILSGEADVTDNYRYKVQSVVRNRIKKHLADDVEFLEEHFEEGHELALEAFQEATDADAD